MHTKNKALSKGRANYIDHLVSKKLKIRRLLLGFTQQELGDAIEVSIHQVQKYENGTNRISSGKLFNIAEFLRVPVTYFFKQKNYFSADLNYNFAEDQEEYTADFLENQSQNSHTYEENINRKMTNNYCDSLVPFVQDFDKDVIGLIKAFSEIKNEQLRRKIVELMKLINIPCESDKLR